MEDVNKRRRIFLSPSKLECGGQKINSWEMPQICHFQRTGRNATKFKENANQFKSDVFATVAIVDAKAPQWLELTNDIIRL